MVAKDLEEIKEMVREILAIVRRKEENSNRINRFYIQRLLDLEQKIKEAKNGRW